MNPMKIYYMSNWLFRKKMPILPIVFQWILFVLFKAVVPYQTRIGKNCVLSHGGVGVVIHKKAIIGDNVCICHQVTIGGRGRWDNVPLIGDDVYISPGAKIIGPVRIGNNSIVAPNSVVLKNIPEKCIAAGIPARILRRNVNSRDVEKW